LISIKRLDTAGLKKWNDDRFALACCPVILATPVSSYSHYAARVLGPVSLCLIPPPRMPRSAPAAVQPRLERALLFDWMEVSLDG
jgi:hypothetical protein